MSNYRSIKEVAATVRTTLKKEFPNEKFSVTKESFSGGSALNVTLVQGIEPAFVNDDSRGYAQLNDYVLRDSKDYAEYTERRGNVVMTQYAFDLMKKVERVANAENWNNSDAMTDYFDVNYYMHLSIGSWDKPYAVK